MGGESTAQNGARHGGEDQAQAGHATQQLPAGCAQHREPRVLRARPWSSSFLQKSHRDREKAAAQLRSSDKLRSF